MNQKINSIIILGGGTAGWLAALLLKKNLGPELNITLIESPKKPIIGVGEATVPTIRFTMKHLGFDESDWMARCQASFKLAVKFDNWLTPNHSYYHPFHHNRSFANLTNPFYKLPDLPSQFDLLQFYSNIEPKNRPSDFATYCSFVPSLCDHLKSPLNFEKHSRTSNYAYHFDTHLLNAFFREKAEERGIQYIDGIFQEAPLTETGHIKSIKLQSGKEIFGDLFIDCTGFNSLLLGGVLQEKFITQEKHLFCDSALAVQIPYENREVELQPYTSAIAMDAGWVWKIPLQHRIGTGYVYSSQFKTEEQAFSEFQKLYPTRVKDMNPRSLKMKVGRHQRTWVKNCVALGLASCFIEPLESTSIGLTEYQIHSLIQLFPDKNFSPHLQTRFNQKINYCYDQLRDYIVLHYYLSKRQDTPFWKAVTQDNTLPESVKSFLNELPSWVANPKPDSDWVFFQRFNLGCILSGMDSLPYVKLPILDLLKSEDIATQFQKVKAEEQLLINELPKLSDYLLRMRKTDENMLIGDNQ